MNLVAINDIDNYNSYQNSVILLLLMFIVIHTVHNILQGYVYEQ